MNIISVLNIVTVTKSRLTEIKNTDEEAGRMPNTNNIKLKIKSNEKFQRSGKRKNFVFYV